MIMSWCYHDPEASRLVEHGADNGELLVDCLHYPVFNDSHSRDGLCSGAEPRFWSSEISMTILLRRAVVSLPTMLPGEEVRWPLGIRGER
jgi:hypothetical protein